MHFTVVQFAAETNPSSNPDPKRWRFLLYNTLPAKLITAHVVMHGNSVQTFVVPSETRTYFRVMGDLRCVSLQFDTDTMQVQVYEPTHFVLGGLGAPIDNKRPTTFTIGPGGCSTSTAAL